jgi:hypothetical protein
MMTAKKVNCVICNKEYNFINNTHLKSHGLTIAEYKRLYPDSNIKSDSLRKKCGDSTRNKTYEDIYGISKAIELRTKRSNDAKKQMIDSNQRYIRRIKCGKPEHYTDERKQNMSNSITESVKEQRRNTIIQNIELGKYNTKLYGRQSVQALTFIKDYLYNNNISEDYCYFDQGGINGNEYFSVVYNPITNRKKTIAYDLVVTSDKKHLIQTIIEINGPWHYHYNEVLEDPYSPSCPLKSNKMTKLESYNIDALKINKALELSKDVFIFWLNNKTLIQITEPIKLINL